MEDSKNKYKCIDLIDYSSDEIEPGLLFVFNN